MTAAARSPQRPKKKTADGDAPAKSTSHDDDAVYGAEMPAAFDAAGVSAFLQQAVRSARGLPRGRACRRREGVRALVRARKGGRLRRGAQANASAVELTKLNACAAAAACRSSCPPLDALRGAGVGLTRRSRTDQPTAACACPRRPCVRAREVRAAGLRSGRPRRSNRTDRCTNTSRGRPTILPSRAKATKRKSPPLFMLGTWALRAPAIPLIVDRLLCLPRGPQGTGSGAPTHRQRFGRTAGRGQWLVDAARARRGCACRSRPRRARRRRSNGSRSAGEYERCGHSEPFRSPHL
jgi:hypothetical protein